jgi:16S rRNA (cytidine1402-2'-O)-methyltransferase
MSASSVTPATLYVVATPIGNLADMSRRACEVLAGVDAILAEDTRVSATLLRHYGIGTPLTALHQHNEARRSARIIERLAAGESLALISDAGTPGISDPGARLVRTVRAAGHAIVPVPGASALTAALSVAGLDGPVLFVGFLPARQAGRQQAMKQADASGAAWVIYESPHRLADCLADLASVVGASRPVLLAREITKRFESIVRLEAGALCDWLAADADHGRGEFVIVIEPVAEPVARAAGASGDAVLDALLAELPVAQAVRIAQTITGERRNELYPRALARKALLGDTLAEELAAGEPAADEPVAEPASDHAAERDV